MIRWLGTDAVSMGPTEEHLRMDDSVAGHRCCINGPYRGAPQDGGLDGWAEMLYQRVIQRSTTGWIRWLGRYAVSTGHTEEQHRMDD
jgi:hypothetical protein